MQGGANPIPQRTVGNWTEYRIVSTGKVYYYNMATGITQWNAPPEMVLV
jgi:hypothetical protein